MSAIFPDQYFDLATYQPHLNFYSSPIHKILPEDLSYWRKIADKGSTDFQLKVARFYEDIGNFSFALYYYGMAAPMIRHHKNHLVIGRFIERLMNHSLEEAINHLLYATNQNNPLAFYVLAKCYLKGAGVQKSLKDSLHHFQQAARFGYPCDFKDIAEGLSKLHVKKLTITRFLKKLLAQNEKERAWQFNHLATLFETTILGCHPGAAIYYHKLAASLGEKLSFVRLGDIYFRGLLGIEKNEGLGIHYYLLGEHLGPVNLIAEQYEKSDPEQAFECYRKMFEIERQNDCWSSLIKIGNCYRFGNGVEQSLEKAMDCYRWAIEHGYISAFSGLCTCFVGRNRFDIAAECLKKGAEQGDGECAHWLGWWFETGVLFEVEKSEKQAFEYYKLAVRRGVEKAYPDLLRCYLDGIGTEKSYEKAFDIYRLLGDDCEIASCYLRGQGVLKSLDLAHYHLFYLIKKGKMGDLVSCASLLKDEYQSQLGLKLVKDSSWGSLVTPFVHFACQISSRLNSISGELKQTFLDAKRICLEIVNWRVTKPDQLCQLGIHFAQEGVWVQAFDYFKKSANKGFPSAQYYLEKYFQFGSDNGNAEASFLLAKDEQAIHSWSQKALFYFNRAAHQNHLESIWLLFEHYHNGELCQESQKKALIYLRLGAELDHTKCQYYLGEYYIHGFGGLKPSIEEAFKYYRLAAKKGHRRALISLHPRILHPSAQPVDISAYEETQDLQVLKTILEGWGHQPIFLEMTGFSWEETQVICEAMIENPHLTFMCQERDESRLFLAFELAGHHPAKDLSYKPIVNPVTCRKTWGYVFTAYDVRDSALKGNCLATSTEIDEQKWE